ncbi:MAG: hypothetical protein IPP27_04915 [Bacteroidetes bacterium]|nr:hypothetical protein [Bacteroidota bacterium]MBP6426087.1 hypothetical protein [Bacteroidia bacterium]MBK8363925.1 hypothetical protein [Bacteroidota bacterium]MBK9415107.1 hypothetical protein [Bacteroidota bacterium]MBL0031539.1 hypothetical protein [Bacteroidota bacterium]
MKAIKKEDVDKNGNQLNLSAFKRIDKLLKKHSQIQAEDNLKSGGNNLQNLKNLNDGL